MRSVVRTVARIAGHLVPRAYRQTFVGDLMELYEARCARRGRSAAILSLLVEAVHSAPSLLRWRLTQESSMSHVVESRDPFRLGQLTPRTTAGRTVSLFKSFYLRALAIFLLVHFPLRVVGHFLRTDEAIGTAVGGVAGQALIANGLLLVSWCLVEGALLATLAQGRKGSRPSIGAALSTSMRKLPAFLAARALFLVGTVAGLALLIVPGVVFACVFMLHGWLIFDRDLGPIAALAESARMVKTQLRKTLGLSLPVAAMNLTWVVVGVVFVALTLRVTAPVMPIFKVAPFTMTIMETGFLLFTILTGIVYANYSADAPSGTPA